MRRIVGWLKARQDAFDDWVFNGPFWLVVPLAVFVVLLWLALCIFLGLLAVELITKVMR